MTSLEVRHSRTTVDVGGPSWLVSAGARTKVDTVGRRRMCHGCAMTVRDCAVAKQAGDRADGRQVVVTAADGRALRGGTRHVADSTSRMQAPACAEYSSSECEFRDVVSGLLGGRLGECPRVVCCQCSTNGRTLRPQPGNNNPRPSRRPSR